MENTEVRKAIIDLLGTESFTASPSHPVTGTYNPAYVAQRVFAEPDLLHQLNAIVHPAVKKDISRQSSAVNLLFVESAILYEAGMDELCEGILIVDAPEEVRIARTIARDYKGDASPENINKVRARVRSQQSVFSSQLSVFSSQLSENKKALHVINDGRTSISELADMIVRQYCAAS